MAQSPLPVSMRDATRILFRQKWRASLTFLFIVGLTAAAILFSPRTYVSEGQLYLRLGREDTSLDPVAAPGENISVQIEREGEIKSAVEILRSRGVLTSVVEAVGADAILTQQLPDETRQAPAREIPGASWIGSLRSAASKLVEGGDPVSAEEKAVRKLISWVSVSTERKSSVITVMCKSGSPRLSQRIVGEVIAEFQRRHIVAHRSEGSRQFFADQAERLRHELADASQRLRDAKNAVGVVSIETERGIIQTSIDDLNQRIAQASASLAEAETKVASLQRRQQPRPSAGGVTQVAAALPATDVASGLTPQALDDMRKDLYLLEMKDLELSSKYFENHPQRMAIHEQVQEGRRILAEQELQMERSNVATHRAHLQSLRTRTSEAEAQLQRLNRAEIELSELEEEVGRLKKVHSQYAENYEVSRINEALEAQRITNVRVVQDPTLQHKPVSPRKMVLAVLGLMASVLGAGGVALASEYFDPTLRTPDEVESQLEVPVLVSIPNQSRHRVTLA